MEATTIAAIALAVYSGLTEIALILAACMAQGRRPQEPGITPGLTVILPYKEHEPSFEMAVRSLLLSPYPSERLRIVLVDDHSPADHAVALARLRCDFPDLDLITVQAEREPGPGENGKALALIRGLAFVRPEPSGIVVFADADCEYPPGYLLQLAATVEETPHVLVSTGYALPQRTARVIAFMWQTLIQQYLWGGASALHLLPAAWGGAMAVRLDALQQVGGLTGLEHVIAEDVVLANRFAIAGYWPRHVVFSPPVIHHTHLDRMTLRRWVFGMLDAPVQTPRFCVAGTCLVAALLVFPVVLALWNAFALLFASLSIPLLASLGALVAVESGLILCLAQREQRHDGFYLLPAPWILRTVFLRAFFTGRRGTFWKGRRIDTIRSTA